MTKKLQELADLLPEAKITGNLDILIEQVAYDSRKVKQGALFICLPGAKVDGHDYISQAVASGAVALLVEKEVKVSGGIAVIKVSDTRAAMQILAPYFFDYPGHKMRMIGITGTNGKTTTSYLLQNILKEAGYKVGVIGTIQTVIGERVLPIKNTTPDVVDLQEILSMMAEENMDYVVMEVSSHALSLGRVAGCEFDAGIFTNMTRDHLDFHKTFENYAQAKALLFKSLGAPGAVKEKKTAIINIDDQASAVMLENTHCRVLTYGIRNEQAQLKADHIQIGSKGTFMELSGDFGAVPIQAKITGIFNVYNILSAAGAALAEGIDVAIIRAALEKFQSVPGRFEIIDCGQPFSVIVDFAHTPDGLENILKTAKEFAKGRIIIVFGCGGDRDRTKRPIMGKLAVQYADIIVATSDNPRTEDPVQILNEIENGIKEVLTPGKIYEKITDRKMAIARAIGMAAPDDIILIAGKGHETYQILKDRTIHFDDREVARDVLREMR